MAHIVGALTNRTSVTFSPPGLLDGRRKFRMPDGSRVHNAAAYHRSVAVIMRYSSVELTEIMCF